jgi:CysZ protein
MITGSFALALGQLGDRRFLRVFLLGILLTLVLLVGAVAAVLWLIQWIDPSQIALPIVGKLTYLTDFLAWASVFLVIVFSVFLMVPVASAITALFLDDVADAVEVRHYPDLPPAGRVTFWRGVGETIRFLGLMILVNLLALTTLMFLPFLYPFVFWAANGWLLGREYFLIAALRRESSAEARALVRRNFGTIWWAGCLMALPLTMPLVNLAIPVLGAATFTHIYHRLAGRRPTGA